MMRAALVTDPGGAIGCGREDSMKRVGLSWFAVAAIVVHAGCSTSEGPDVPASEQAGARPGAVGAGGAGADLSSDRDFVRDIAMKHLAETEISRVALQKSTDPDIRSFAQQVIDDHTSAGDSLKAVVSGQGIEWPAHLDEKHREIADALMKKQGAKFDRDFLEAMVEGHQNLTAKLESRLDVQSLAEWKTAAAARTRTRALPEPTVAMRDVEVRPHESGNRATMQINQWAADTYPVAQKHLDTARRLEHPTQKSSSR
jgi:putative membrane protein